MAAAALATTNHHPLFTVGHSALPTSELIGLLQEHGIEAVVDIRSQPYSRLHPQHNREALGRALNSNGMRYAFMGDALGGRPGDERHYDDDGYVDYGSWAKSDIFQAGLERLARSAERYRAAVLCSEEDPNQCHRHLLVARVLVDRGWDPSDILHIRAKGSVLPESSIPRQSSFGSMESWRSPQSVLHRVLQNTSSVG